MISLPEESVIFTISLAFLLVEKLIEIIFYEELLEGF